MTGQITSPSMLSLELVALVVGVSMLLGAADVIRQPGWAWKRAEESKAAYFILVLLIPIIGLGVYAFSARPKLVALAAAGPEGALPSDELEGQEVVGEDHGGVDQPTVIVDRSEAIADRAEVIVPVVTVDRSEAIVDQPEVIVPVVTVDQPAAHVDQPAAHVDQPAAHVDQPAVIVDQPAAMTSGTFGFDTLYREADTLGQAETHDNHPPVPEPAPPAPPAPAVQAGPMEISSTFFSNEGGHSRSGHLPHLTLTRARTYRPKQRTSLGLPDDETPVVPAGWKNDPTERHQFRYWDGFHWTENVADAGNQSRDPVSS